MHIVDMTLLYDWSADCLQSKQAIGSEYIKLLPFLCPHGVGLGS